MSTSGDRATNCLGPLDRPLVTFLRPWKLYSTTSSRHPSFKQILKWKSTQHGAKCYMYWECWCEWNGICNRHLCCLFFESVVSLKCWRLEWKFVKVWVLLTINYFGFIWGPVGMMIGVPILSVMTLASTHLIISSCVSFFPKKPQMISSGFKLTELN